MWTSVEECLPQKGWGRASTESVVYSHGYEPWNGTWVLLEGVRESNEVSQSG